MVAIKLKVKEFVATGKKSWIADSRLSEKIKL